MSEEHKDNSHRLIHRYVDGDLSAEELGGLAETAKLDPSVCKRVYGLLEVRSLVQEAVQHDAGELDSEALFRGVLAQIDADTRVAPAKVPALKVIDGGRKEIPAVADKAARNRRFGAVLIAGFAVAAAAYLIVGRPGTPAPIATAPDTAVEPIAPAEPSWANRTEVLDVDFGTNIGTIFSVDGEPGERFAVVWLDDTGVEDTAAETAPTPN